MKMMNTDQRDGEFRDFGIERGFSGSEKISLFVVAKI